MARRFSTIWKSAAACLVLCVGLGVGLSADQDTTTLLSKFLVDLRNGNLGVANAISKILVGDGSASAPSYSFASETNTGLFRVSAGSVGFAASGNEVARTASGGFVIAAPQSLFWGSSGTSSPDVSLSRGAANVLTLASGDMLSFGGVAAGNALLKASGSTLIFRTGDDGANAALQASNVAYSATLSSTSGGVLISATAPTVNSAGTSPSVTGNNGTAAFRVNVGTGGTATTIVMTMPAATTGWNCDAQNITANAANRANQHVVQQASTTTSVTVQNQTISTGAALAFTASDIVRFICFAY